MKKLTIVLMVFFLLFSLNVSSQDKPHKKAQSAKIEHSRNGKVSKRKPAKSTSKKMTHKSAPKHSSKKRSGVKL